MYDGVKWIDQVWLRRSYHEKKKFEKLTKELNCLVSNLIRCQWNFQAVKKSQNFSREADNGVTNEQTLNKQDSSRFSEQPFPLGDYKMQRWFKDFFFFFAFSHFFSLVSKCNHCFAKFVAAGESCAKWRLRTGSQTLSVQGPALQSQFVRGSFGNTWGMPLPRGRPSGRLLRGTSRLLKWSWLIFTFECH
jgi:hypothetical protein